MGLEISENEVEMFIVNILKLLRREESSISSAFSPLIGTCKQCDERITLKSKYIHRLNSKKIVAKKDIVCMTETVMNLCEPYSNQCCSSFTILDESSVKSIIILFSEPIVLNICSSKLLWGRPLKYLCHIKEIPENETL